MPSTGSRLSLLFEMLTTSVFYAIERQTNGGKLGKYVTVNIRADAPHCAFQVSEFTPEAGGLGLARPGNERHDDLCSKNNGILKNDRGCVPDLCIIMENGLRFAMRYA